MAETNVATSTESICSLSFHAGRLRGGLSFLRDGQNGFPEKSIGMGNRRAISVGRLGSQKVQFQARGGRCIYSESTQRWYFRHAPKNAWAKHPSGVWAIGDQVPSAKSVVYGSIDVSSQKSICKRRLAVHLFLLEHRAVIAQLVS